MKNDATTPSGGFTEPARAASEQAASASSADAVQLDYKRQEQAIAFARSRRRIRSMYLFPLFVVLILCFISALTFSQISSSIMTLMIALDDAPVLSWHPIASWTPCLVLFYSILISLFVVALSLPLTWLSGFRLLRRYGLLKEKTSAWLRRSLISLGLIFVFLWLFAELIFLLMIVQPQVWWAWAALAQYLFSLLMARFGLRWLSLRKVHPVRDGAIVERLQMLLDRLQLPSCPLFLVRVSHRTSSANAYFSGIGRGRRIRLTDTMVSNLTLDEIEVILAHELGHYVHHDIWTRLIMRALTILALLYVLYLLFNPALLVPLLPSQLASFIPLLIYLLILVFLYLTFSYRRYQEYQADEFALQVTGKVQTFKDAMTKLTNMSMVVAVSTRRARHPASHPALMKRLQHADEFAARQHISPIS